MQLRFLLLVLLALPAQLIAQTVLITHVNGYTLDGTGELQRFPALLVRDGRVLATGEFDELVTRATPVAIHDGQGRTLLPGLIDAHGHVMGLGWSLQEVDLAGTRSLEEGLARIRAWAAAHPDAAWVTGRGWNQVLWGLGRFPTAAELDRAVPDRPVWLRRVDGHAGWANTAALKLAGIDARTADPGGGRIERDAAGQPRGVLVDGAMDLIETRVPNPGPEESRAALHAALAEMARVGLTGVHDAGVDADTIALYRRKPKRAASPRASMPWSRAPVRTSIGSRSPVPGSVWVVITSPCAQSSCWRMAPWAAAARP
jgi:predicted amidohydrolase YtcJ